MCMDLAVTYIHHHCGLIDWNEPNIEQIIENVATSLASSDGMMVGRDTLDLIITYLTASQQP